jgi:hypothetical protein
LDRRLGGPQSQSGHCGVEKKLLPLLGIKPWLSSLQPVAIAIELSWLTVSVLELTEVGNFTNDHNFYQNEFITEWS